MLRWQNGDHFCIVNQIPKKSWPDLLDIFQKIKGYHLRQQILMRCIASNSSDSHRC